MTTYAPGDVLLVDFPFVSGGTTVLRPALVILDTGDDDVVLSRITTQGHRTPFDTAIKDWQGAGLRAASFVRLHKLVTAEKACVSRRLGALQHSDRQAVAAILRTMFASW
jgi:mRNA interferase MazF